MGEDNKLYKSIGDVAKILNLVDKKSGKLSTHTIRFWEKEFKQIKPKIFSGRRRYYDDKTIKIIKDIYFFLKNKGMTIKGVKKLLQNEYSDLDDINNKTIRTDNVKSRLNKISNLIKEIKNNG